MPELDISPPKRCAIYTRKSVNHFLDRDIASLDAQREICSAYVSSQRHKCWVELPARYDDSGQSGADMERPALSRLMRDIEAGEIDVVVIYKIDRLTRSLMDFVRLIEVFDRHDIAFVSISQSFDTSDSLGRMILNILLTFSQFEREMIAERVRDNVRARKRRGAWTGGPPPFGYELTDKGLKIVVREADIVRFIFSSFLKFGTYRAVQEAAWDAGWRSEVKYTKAGARRGGRLLSSGMIYKVLNNPVYIGEIKGHDRNYAGRHEPIISQETWIAAQTLRKTREKPTPQWMRTDHFLVGLLYDSFGRRMLLATEKYGQRKYHFYVSSNAYWSQRQRCKQFRSHAARLDELILATVSTFLADREQMRAALKKLGLFGEDLEVRAARGARAAVILNESPAKWLPAIMKALLESVELAREHVTIVFRCIELHRFLFWTGMTEFHGRPRQWCLSDARFVLELPVRAVSRERSPILRIAGRDDSIATAKDTQLIGLLQRARRAQKMVEDHRELSLGEIASAFRCRPAHFARLIRLNFLAPDIVTAILDGAQPSTLTKDRLFGAELPLDWALQRRLLGFPLEEHSRRDLDGTRSRERLAALHDRLPKTSAIGADKA